MAVRTDETATEHLCQNVETIAALHARANEGIGHHQRFVERLTTLIGRPASLYLILLTAAVWIVFNLLGARVGLAHPPDPPPFFWLQGVIGLAALLTTTVVLTAQNRQGKQNERRAELDLQINL